MTWKTRCPAVISRTRRSSIAAAGLVLRREMLTPVLRGGGDSVSAWAGQRPELDQHCFGDLEVRIQLQGLLRVFERRLQLPEPVVTDADVISGAGLQAVHLDGTPEECEGFGIELHLIEKRS